jgi:hypothetical protein
MGVVILLPGNLSLSGVVRCSIKWNVARQNRNTLELIKRHKYRSTLRAHHYFLNRYVNCVAESDSFTVLRMTIKSAGGNDVQTNKYDSFQTEVL